MASGDRIWPVYGDEKPSGVYMRPWRRPAPAEVCLDIAAFIGVARHGPQGLPVGVDSLSELVAAFGPPVPGYALYESVRLFFDNGGRRAVVINAAAPVLEDTTRACLLTADEALQRWDDRHETEPVATVCIPDLVFAAPPARPEAPPRAAPPLGTRFSDELPTPEPESARPPAPLIPGLHGPLRPVDIEDIRLLLDRCAARDRVLLLDGAPGLDAEDLQTRHLVVLRPWLRVGGRTLPACGAVAGLVAARERARGVAATPSGQVLRGADGVEPLSTKMTSGLNTIQRTTSGLVLDGACTTQNGEWSSWPAVRLFQYLRRQLALDLRWAVFEPVDARLAHRVETVVCRRMDRLLAAGALASPRAEDSYRVRVTLDPDAAALHIELGLAPARPTAWLVLVVHLDEAVLRWEAADV